MRLFPLLFILFGLLFPKHSPAQDIYRKSPELSFVKTFRDSADRVKLTASDSGLFLEKRYAYVLRFYPHMLFKNIEIRFVDSKHPVKLKVPLASLFKAPEQRKYSVRYSKNTGSTMDSVLIQQLSLNASLGFIGLQVSNIEELSTGGFFNFLYWYARSWSKKGRRKLYRAAEYRCLEVGLGYQILDYTAEFNRKLQIEQWQNTNGFDTYNKYYRNLASKNSLLSDLIGDLPVYMSHSYR